MPGAVGIIRVDGQPATVDAALAKLHHLSTYRSARMQLAQGVSLGVVSRGSTVRDYDWHYNATRQVGVLVAGTMIGSEPNPHVMTASDIFREYQAHMLTRWDKFEGGFIAVIVDFPKDRMFIANDRLGVLPLYYTKQPNFFAFAPEAKGVLVHDGGRMQLSLAGLANFLCAGYCFGDLTLFEGLNVLEPSTLLSIHLRTLALEKTRLWKIVYEPARALNRRRAAEEALSQAMVAAHKATLCDAPSKVGIWVSGGWDARGILATLDKLNYQAHEALSWGIRDDMPGSDVVLARRLAEEFKIPFVYTCYDSDAVAEYANSWCYLSELITDNFAWFAEGPGLFSGHPRETTDVTLLGDEAWGWQGYVADEAEARAAVFPSRLPQVLRTLLHPSFISTAEEMYEDAVQRIARPCENSDFVDRKDFMYLHGRIARFIFPLRYFKEFTTPLRRPYLSNAILETVRHLPGQYRLFKSLYISMLYRHFPLAVSVPRSRMNCLPDWEFDIRRKPSLRHLFLRLLDFGTIEQGALEQMLDRTAFVQLRDNFFSFDAQPLSRFDPWWRVLKRRIELELSRSHWLTSTMHSMHRRANVRPTSAFELLRRIALVSLLQENMSDLS